MPGRFIVIRAWPATILHGTEIKKRRWLQMIPAPFEVRHLERPRKILLRSVRQQRHDTGSFYSRGKLALVTSAIARNSAGQYLAPFGDKALELLVLLEINARHIIYTKATDFLFGLAAFFTLHQISSLTHKV